MKIDQLLEEGISSIVYHTTAIDTMFNILSSDKIHTSGAFIHRESNLSKDRLFYLSTSRSKSSSYLSEQGDANATMKLDGRLLGSRYKGHAMDYFASRNRFQDIKIDEMEDRVITDTPYIPNASRYIQEIDILIDPDKETPQFYFKYLTSIHFLAARKGITVRVYMNRRDLITNNVRRTRSVPKAISFFMGGDIPKTVEEYKDTMMSNMFKRDNAHVPKIKSPSQQRVDADARFLVKVLTINENDRNFGDSSFTENEWREIAKIPNHSGMTFNRVLNSLRGLGKHKTIQDLVRIARRSGAGTRGISDLDDFLINRAKILLRKRLDNMRDF